MQIPEKALVPIDSQCTVLPYIWLRHDEALIAFLDASFVMRASTRTSRRQPAHTT